MNISWRVSVAALAVIVAMIGGSCRGATEASGRIALSLSPDSIGLTRGASGTVGLSIARTNFAGEVALAVVGAPSGLSVTSSSATTSGNVASLGIEAALNAPLGTHKVTVMGSGSAISVATATLTVTISSAPPP